jgi:hypothetical protein
VDFARGKAYFVIYEPTKRRPDPACYELFVKLNLSKMILWPTDTLFGKLKIGNKLCSIVDNYEKTLSFG